MISAAPHADVEKAREKYYIELADHFLEQVSLKRVNRILEAGCGKGQLTIPLLSKLPRRIKFIAVDSSRGSYAGSLETLLHKLGEGG